VGGVEHAVVPHAVAEAAQVVDGLAGTAQPVAFRLGEPIQARRKRDRLELLADEEPLGQVRGEARSGGGDETVFGMGTEAEVVGQRRIPSFCWSASRGRRMGGTWYGGLGARNGSAGGRLGERRGRACCSFRRPVW
jgi:hypothetical protein